MMCIECGREYDEKELRYRCDRGGLFESVSDEEILRAQHLLASREGLFVELASATPLAGLMKLLGSGELERGESYVLITTGHGLKDPNVVVNRFTLPEPIEPTLEAFREVME
ncbi:pyridoxal-phosphate dependent enzyme [Thermococcus henrietii]|uniref:pyridoxal-phosphate dependent enzyme n=1 Tax=Thermococcus henrietii TaxID=2016361 RepID=UPI0037447B62